LTEEGLISHLTGYRSFRGEHFYRSHDLTHQQCQNTEGGPQSNHAHLTVSQYYNMHADIIQENNLTHTKKSKHSEWTQWDEAKSGRQNL